MFSYPPIIKHALYFLLVCVLVIAPSENSSARSNTSRGSEDPRLIMDAEIAYRLAKIAEPLLPALGDAAERLSLHVMRKNEINAFVTAGTHVVFMSGLIQETESIEELQGVMAHEFGHVLADHYALTVADAERAQRTALLLLLASVPLALVSREAALANALGSPQAVVNLTLSERRARETIADNSAVQILESGKVSPKGMLSFLEKLRGEKASGYSKYLQSHPATQDRIAFLASKVRSSSAYENFATPSAREGFERMRAKIDAFTFSPRITLKKYAKGKFANDEAKRIGAMFARAIAYYRQGDNERALEEVGNLLERRTRDPFFIELRGDILRGIDPRAAQTAYRESLSLLERGVDAGYGDALTNSISKSISSSIAKGFALPIRLSLFDSLLTSADRDDSAIESDLSEAESLMKIALLRSPASILARLRLARLYERQGKRGDRALVWAEALWLRGDYHKAYCSVREALTDLPSSSPARLRADDLAQQVLSNRKRGERFTCS